MGKRKVKETQKQREQLNRSKSSAVTATPTSESMGVGRYLRSLWSQKYYITFFLTLFVAVVAYCMYPLRNQAKPALNAGVTPPWPEPVGTGNFSSSLPALYAELPKPPLHMGLLNQNEGVFEAINALSIGIDPNDAQRLGLTEAEYDRQVNPNQLRTLMLASGHPKLVEQCLGKAKVVLRHDALSVSSDVYSGFRVDGAGRGWLAIVSSDSGELARSSRQFQLRNEMFHCAMFATRGEGPNIHKLPMEVIHSISSALKLGREMIHSLWESLLNNLTDQFTDLQKDFFSAVSVYQPAPNAEIISQKPSVFFSEYIQLEDGRYLLPAGKFKLNGKPTRCDIYATVESSAKAGTFKVIYSTLGGDTLAHKVLSFFADHYMRMQRYKGEGHYADHSFRSKTLDLASDVMSLPTALRNFFYQSFCNIYSELTGVAGSCNTPEVEIVSDENAYEVVPRY